MLLKSNFLMSSYYSIFNKGFPLNSKWKLMFWEWPTRPYTIWAPLVLQPYLLQFTASLSSLQPSWPHCFSQTHQAYLHLKCLHFLFSHSITTFFQMPPFQWELSWWTFLKLQPCQHFSFLHCTCHFLRYNILFIIFFSQYNVNYIV